MAFSVKPRSQSLVTPFKPFNIILFNKPSFTNFKQTFCLVSPLRFTSFHRNLRTRITGCSDNAYKHCSQHNYNGRTEPRSVGGLHETVEHIFV